MGQAGSARRAARVGAGFLVTVLLAGLAPVVAAETGGAATSPGVGIGDVSVWEGDAKTRSVLFPVTLSQPSLSVVTVKVQIAGGTATLGNSKTSNVDANNKGGKVKTLTFKPGKVAKNVAVPVDADGVAEPTFGPGCTSSVPEGTNVGRAPRRRRRPAATLSGSCPSE